MDSAVFVEAIRESSSKLQNEEEVGKIFPPELIPEKDNVQEIMSSERNKHDEDNVEADVESVHPSKKYPSKKSKSKSKKFGHIKKKKKLNQNLSS